MFDTQDNDGFSLSNFDKLKIESMNIGDAIDGESGDFRILRYKDGYMLFVFSESLIRKTQSTYKEFFDINTLIEFLSQN